jgi:hypothetical protein
MASKYLSLGGVLSIVATASFALSANAMVLLSDRSEFSGGLPPGGWTAAESGFASPEYSNSVVGVSVAYVEFEPEVPGMVSLYAIPGGGGAESKVAEFRTVSTNAAFSFPVESDFRSFRIVTNGASVVSFESTWPKPSVLAVSGAQVAAAGESGYFENFDVFSGIANLSPWDEGVILPYWQTRNAKTGLPIDKIRISTASTPEAGGVYGYHRANTDSYSLAIVSNTKADHRIGFTVTNDTETSLVNFSLSYKIRQWTFKAGSNVQTNFFEYIVADAVEPVSSTNGWTLVPSLNFEAVASLEAADESHVDLETGTVFADMQTTLDGVSLPKGHVLTMRWRVNGVSGGDAFGIDDVRLTCEKQAVMGTRVYLVKSGGNGFSGE